MLKFQVKFCLLLLVFTFLVNKKLIVEKSFTKKIKN